MPAVTPDPREHMQHWRSFGPAEWRHVRDGALGVLLGSVLPLVLFYYAVTSWSFNAAIVLVLSWAAGVFFWHLRRTGTLDVFSATTFVFACIKATAGLVSQNLTLYLAWPSLENLIYGTVFLGSAMLGRPVLGLYAQRLYPIPRLVRQTRLFQRAFLVVSVAWFIGHGLRGLMRLGLVSLYQQDILPLHVYLIIDYVGGWPITVPLVAFTAWYPIRQFRKAGLMVPPPGIEAVERAVEEAAPGTI
jgi:hypothetical protein